MNRYVQFICLLSLFISSFSMAVSAKPVKILPSQKNIAAVNVNTASATELSVIKGLGLKKANEIVHYRQAHGDFKTLQDLTAVKGIGVKTLARLEKRNPGQLVVNTTQKLG